MPKHFRYKMRILPIFPIIFCYQKQEMILMDDRVSRDEGLHVSAKKVFFVNNRMPELCLDIFFIACLFLFVSAGGY